MEALNQFALLRYLARHTAWLAKEGAAAENLDPKICAQYSELFNSEANTLGDSNGLVDTSEPGPKTSPAEALPSGWLGSKGMQSMWNLDEAPLVDIGALSKDRYDELTGNTWGKAFANGAAVGVAEVGGRKALKLRLNRLTGAGKNGTGKIQGRIPIEPSAYVKTRVLVYFPEGFDFGGLAMTGKIGAGIFFGDELSSGLNLKAAGGSFRPCFGQVNQSDRQVHPRPYLYRQDQKRRYGDGDAVPHINVDRGQWIEIIMEGHAQSSSSKADGQGRMWWNGELVYEDVRIPWVKSGSVLSKQIIWDFFLGGSNSSKEPDLYSPEKDQEMYVAEMSYTTQRLAA